MTGSRRVSRSECSEGCHLGVLCLVWLGVGLLCVAIPGVVVFLPGDGVSGVLRYVVVAVVVVSFLRGVV